MDGTQFGEIVRFRPRQMLIAMEGIRMRPLVWGQFPLPMPANDNDVPDPLPVAKVA